VGAYIAIDMKSFYASVECVSRGLDPLKTDLLVADESRSDKTICLAVSPSLKAKGVPSRPRLFEARQAIALWESRNRKKLSWLIAVPRMREYERVSARIHDVILQHVAPEDVHVYSIDESFINAEPYLHFFRKEAEEQGLEPERLMALAIVRAILRATGITATVGVGSNLYLAKVCMDIVAKKIPADEDGVRIAELNEAGYCLLLWSHRPLTDFWMIGPGKARRLQKALLFTMGDVARKSRYDEAWFYKEFGIDGEILVDHAWGREPVTMKDIKAYRSDSRSLSKGQVLSRPYAFGEARNVFSEMVDVLCADMFEKKLLSPAFSWWVSYDWTSLEYCPSYAGPVCLDFYGRLHPKHSGGTVRMAQKTNSLQAVRSGVLASFDGRVDRRLLVRRLGICACDVAPDDGVVQLDFFTDYDALEKEKNLLAAVCKVHAKYGANALFTGKNMLSGATNLERNLQIGGHRA